MEKQTVVKITKINSWSGIKGFINKPSTGIGDIIFAFHKNPKIGQTVGVDELIAHEGLFGYEQIKGEGKIVYINSKS